MKGLLHILLFAGVVLFGFNTSRANFEGEDTKTPKKDSTSGVNKVLKDTLLDRGKVQVGDTLVFDDYDEDEPTSAAVNHLTFVNSVDIFQPLDEQPVLIENRLTTVLPEAEKQMIESNESMPISESSEWKIYPNPISPSQGNEVWIEHHLSGQVQLTIVDQSGRIVENFDFSGNIFSFHTPSAGIYHLILSSQTQRLSKQLIVR